MSKITQALAAAIAAAALSGCVAHGPQGVAYSRDTPESAGMTSGSGSGAVGASIQGSPDVEKEQRGNTRPGMDRDGHGPAAGAIVDPTGAATRGKPY